jgi:sugar (pentulose or hexulose) kinase
VPAGSDGLLAVLDWLAPVEAPWRRGSLLGLHAGHGRGHVHRCLLEALATTMCDNVAAMARELSTPTRRVVLSGGGARSDLMAQLTADVFGLPVVRTAVTDAAGLGAALCAAVGVGLHGSFEAARRAMVADGDEFTPNLDRHALYRELAEVRRDAAAVTDALGRRTAERRR